jgi:hypothetical protein
MLRKFGHIMEKKESKLRIAAVNIEAACSKYFRILFSTRLTMINARMVI